MPLTKKPFSGPVQDPKKDDGFWLLELPDIAFSLVIKAVAPLGSLIALLLTCKGVVRERVTACLGVWIPAKGVSHCSGDVFEVVNCSMWSVGYVGHRVFDSASILFAVQPSPLLENIVFDSTRILFSAQASPFLDRHFSWNKLAGVARLNAPWALKAKLRVGGFCFSKVSCLDMWMAKVLEPEVIAFTLPALLVQGLDGRWSSPECKVWHSGDRSYSVGCSSMPDLGMQGYERMVCRMIHESGVVMEISVVLCVHDDGLLKWCEDAFRQYKRHVSGGLSTYYKDDKYEFVCEEEGFKVYGLDNGYYEFHTQGSATNKSHVFLRK